MKANSLGGGHQTTPQESPRAPRYASLDVWRGVACLAVVIFHVAGNDRMLPAPSWVTAILTKLWLGVPLFFVISGYCIAAICDAARAKELPFAWYIWRRVRRIFPPYWICLALTVLAAYFHFVGWGIGDPAALRPDQWFGNWTLTEQWRPLVFGNDRSFMISAAWTLCYEEQFYLVCGLILVMAPQWFFRGTAIVSLVALPLALLNWSGAANMHGFFFDGYWFQFAAGVAVYYARNYPGKSAFKWCIGALSGVLALAVILRFSLAPLWFQGFSRPVFLTGTILAFAYAVLILVIERWDAKILSSIWLRPLRLCGVMCYSLYLTHVPIISAFETLTQRYITAPGSTGAPSSISLPEALAALLCCLAGAACFYQLVEKRFLNPSTTKTAPNGLTKNH